MCSAGRPGNPESIGLRSKRLFTGNLRKSHLWRAEGNNLVHTPKALRVQMVKDHNHVLLETECLRSVNQVLPSARQICALHRLPVNSRQDLRPMLSVSRDRPAELVTPCSDRLLYFEEHMISAQGVLTKPALQEC